MMNVMVDNFSSLELAFAVCRRNLVIVWQFVCVSLRSINADMDPCSFLAHSPEFVVIMKIYCQTTSFMLKQAVVFNTMNRRDLSCIKVTHA